VKITHTTICDADLHILNGDVPTCEPGRTLGRRRRARSRIGRDRVQGGRRSRPPRSSPARTSWLSGGTTANVGVHGQKVDLQLEKLRDRYIAIITRLIDMVITPMRLKTMQAKKIDRKIAHHAPVQVR